MSTTEMGVDHMPARDTLPCDQAQRLLMDLGVREAPSGPLAAHLSGCRRCAADYDADRAVRRLLQEAPWPESGLAPNWRPDPVTNASPPPRRIGAAARWRKPSRTGVMPGWPWAAVTGIVAILAVWLGVQIAERGWRPSLGEMAFAGDAGAQVQVCVRNRDGRVRILDAGKVCGSDETALGAGLVPATGPFAAAGGDYRAGRTTIRAGTSSAMVYFSTPMPSSDFRVAVIPTSGAIFAPDGECRYLNVSAKSSDHFFIDVRKCHSASHADQIDRVTEDLDLDWIALPSR